MSQDKWRGTVVLRPQTAASPLQRHIHAGTLSLANTFSWEWAKTSSFNSSLKYAHTKEGIFNRRPIKSSLMHFLPDTWMEKSSYDPPNSGSLVVEKDSKFLKRTEVTKGMKWKDSLWEGVWTVTNHRLPCSLNVGGCHLMRGNTTKQVATRESNTHHASFHNSTLAWSKSVRFQLHYTDWLPFERHEAWRRKERGLEKSRMGGGLCFHVFCSLYFILKVKKI